MRSNPISMKDAYKRKRCLSSSASIQEAAIPELDTSMSNEKYSAAVTSYMHRLPTYKGAIRLIESLYNDNRTDLIKECVSIISNVLIPMTPSDQLSECVSYIECSSIEDDYKATLIEAAKNYKTIDRILENHNMLSKRFENENIFYSRIKSNKDTCYTICEMVDTYSASPYHKFNIALEEVAYLAYTANADISYASMAENVLNYFLLRNDNTSEDITSYIKSIKETKVLGDTAMDNIAFVEQTEFSNSWKDRLNEWKLDPDKSLKTLTEICQDNSSNIAIMRNIVDVFKEYCDINDFEFEKESQTLFESIISECESGTARNILDIVSEQKINLSEGVIDTLSAIWESDINDEVYANGNPEKPLTFTSDEIESYKLDTLISTAQDAAEMIDNIDKKYLKEKPVYVEDILNATYDENYINKDNFIDYVDENGYINLKIKSYNYNHSIDDANVFAESVIKCVNNMLYNTDSVAYYILGENSIDFNIRTKYRVYLSESQEQNKLFPASEKKSLINIFEAAESFDQIYSSPILAITDKLKDRNYAANVTKEEASLVFEIINPYLQESVLSEFVDLCKSECNAEYVWIKQALNTTFHEDMSLTLDHLGRINFCANVMGIDEAKSKTDKYLNDDSDDNQQNNDDEQENEDDQENEAPEENNNQKSAKPQKPAPDQQQNQQPVQNQKAAAPAPDQKNNVDPKAAPAKKNQAPTESPKTVMMKLKDNFQGFKSRCMKGSEKEKEMSRDLDTTFNSFVKGVKSFFLTNKKDAVINGQVNPSLSKMFKVTLAFAAIGKFVNPFLAAVGAAITICKNHNVTTGEKQKLLAEIESELAVLDREIQQCDSEGGSSKKYRTLIDMQKNLQRKRNELYYTIARSGRRKGLFKNNSHAFR